MTFQRQVNQKRLKQRANEDQKMIKIIIANNGERPVNAIFEKVE